MNDSQRGSSLCQVTASPGEVYRGHALYAFQQSSRSGSQRVALGETQGGSYTCHNHDHLTRWILVLENVPFARITVRRRKSDPLG